MGFFFFDVRRKGKVWHNLEEEEVEEEEEEEEDDKPKNTFPILALVLSLFSSTILYYTILL